MAKRRHSLARRHHLGSASGSSSTGWLIGIGAVVAVLGGVWYWRSRRRANLRAKLICGIENARAHLARIQQALAQDPLIGTPLPTLIDPSNIDRTTADIQTMQSGLARMDSGSEPSEAAQQLAMDYC